MIFFTYLIIPVLVAMGFYFLSRRQITRQEFIIHCIACLLCAIVGTVIVHHVQYGDHEVWSGVVSRKEKQWTSCEHSYSCNCVQVSCGENCETQSCSTCYEHSNDYNWTVYSTAPDEFFIDRIDRQGNDEPPRFTAVKMGEPTASVHYYENFIKAAPDTLFKYQGLVEKYQSTIPEYPQGVYDYYHLNRFVSSGVNVPDVNAWNNDLAAFNGEHGPKNKTNVVILSTPQPIEWAKALEQSWIGGKKNDIVVVIGTQPDLKISWVYVIAWSQNSIFQISLRDAIMSIGNLKRVEIIGAVGSNIGLYKRRPMTDFEYLKSSVRPTPAQYVIGMILTALISIALGLIFWYNDEEEYS